MTEFPSVKALKLDFMLKMEKGHVFGYQDYYNLAKARGPDMALQVAENRQVLVIIEQSEKPEVKELPPIKSLRETLNKYCETNTLEESLNIDKVKEILKGCTSKYYDICKNIVETLILGRSDKKSRCVIMTGVADSGKSTLAKYVGQIFDSYGFR